jgi:hypothetical protein
LWIVIGTSTEHVFGDVAAWGGHFLMKFKTTCVQNKNNTF